MDKVGAAKGTEWECDVPAMSQPIKDLPTVANPATATAQPAATAVLAAAARTSARVLNQQSRVYRERWKPATAVPAAPRTAGRVLNHSFISFRQRWKAAAAAGGGTAAEDQYSNRVVST